MSLSSYFKNNQKTDLNPSIPSKDALILASKDYQNLINEGLIKKQVINILAKKYNKSPRTVERWIAKIESGQLIKSKDERALKKFDDEALDYAKKGLPKKIKRARSVSHSMAI